MNLKSKLIIFFTFCLGLFIANYYLAIKLLNYFLKDIEKLNVIVFTNHLGESLNNILSLDLILSLLIIIPILFIWFYNEYKDAFYEKERLGLRLLIIPYILGLIGCAFSYYVTINYMIPFLIGYNLEISIENYLNFTSILNFTLLNMLYFAFVFQTPIIIWILIKFNLIQKEYFKTYRRHFFIGIVIISAIITPADPFSFLLLAIPTQILYELGIIIS